jgi:hypothetical protein
MQKQKTRYSCITVKITKNRIFLCKVGCFRVFIDAPTMKINSTRLETF